MRLRPRRRRINFCSTKRRIAHPIARSLASRHTGSLARAANKEQEREEIEKGEKGKKRKTKSTRITTSRMMRTRRNVHRVDVHDHARQKTGESAGTRRIRRKQ